jgi:c-di-GMP-related signal transduction protein
MLPDRNLRFRKHRGLRTEGLGCGASPKGFQCRGLRTERCRPIGDDSFMNCPADSNPNSNDGTQPLKARALRNASQESSEYRYMARQPIFNGEVGLHGYELLFRSGPDAVFADMSCESATESILDFSLVLGPGSFTDGSRAFINCTEKHLRMGVLHMLPKELVVLEILEQVPANDELVEKCRQLKAEGYTIAIDDIVSVTDRNKLTDLADIIKVDFQLTGIEEQKEIAVRFAKSRMILLAEKVETHEQFRTALKMGYSLFQGYFFCRPETLRRKALPSAHLGYLRVLRQALQSEIDIPEMAKAIRSEPALAYRLLRFMNSARRETYPVESIEHALVLLGTDEIRKWVSIVVAITLAGPRSKELIRTALIRARFCEQVAQHLHILSTDFYLSGLFSLLDALLDRPLDQVLEQLPLSSSCREALQEGSNEPGLALQLAIASSVGDWENAKRYCARLKLSEEDAWGWQLEAQRSVGQMSW